MRFNVKPAGLTSGICGRCTEGHSVEYANGRTETFCLVGRRHRVWHPVVRCDAFEDACAVSQYDMEKIAWTVTTDKSGRKVGFAPPKARE